MDKMFDLWNTPIIERKSDASYKRCVFTTNENRCKKKLGYCDGYKYNCKKKKFKDAYKPTYTDYTRY